MDISRFEEKLSYLPWTKTRVALVELQGLLKCNLCQKLPTSPQYIGRCDHFFCSECITKCTDNVCPICKLPCIPIERKPDTMIRSLISSVNDMVNIINGGEISEESQGFEAPVSCEPEKKVVHHQRSDSLVLINKENVASNPVLNNTVPVPTKAKTKSSTPRGRPAKNPTKSSKATKATTASSKKVNKPKVDAQVSLSIIDAIDVKHTPQNKIKAKVNMQPGVPTTPATPLVNKRNVKGETVLHVTCIKGDVIKVKEMLEQGSNPNTKDNAGWTPLHEACSNGNEGVASLLLEHGALVDVPGSHNMTPLHDAVISQVIPIIVLLRKWGARDTTRDIWGRTPRSLASLTSSPDQINAALDTAEGQFVPKAFPRPLEKKLVFLDSGLNVACKKKLERVAKLVKAKLVTEFSIDVSHVIVQSDKGRRVCSRTNEYMLGVASGNWVLSAEWLDECLMVGELVSPSQFEIEGTRLHPDSGAPRKGRNNAEKMLPGLLSGCHLYFCGSLTGSGNVPQKKHLEALAKAADGFVIQREPNPESIDLEDKTVPFHAAPENPLSSCSHYCIYPEGLQEPLVKYDMPHIKTLPLSWLYDSIDCWTLHSPVLYK